MDNITKFVSKQDIANLEHMNTVQHLCIKNLQNYCTELEQKIKHLELVLSNVSSLDVIPPVGGLKPL